MPFGSVGAKQLVRLTSDASAQVSFSVVAVGVLLLASLSGVYFAKREMDRAEDAERSEMLALMAASIDEVRLEVSLFASAEAYGIVSRWDEFPVNETRISSEFSSAVQEYLEDTFPRERSGLSLSVSNWSGGLFFVEKQTMDVSPPDEPEPASIELEGVEMDYEGMPPPTTDGLAVTTANPYYTALGNMSVAARASSASLSKEVSFDRPIISALPFLETKLRAFEAASVGEFSDLGRMVGYMLTTLAQLRALEGYGVPTYTGLDTSAILTEVDAYRAVATALLVEQARLFRDLDREFAAEVVSACGGSLLGLSALEGSQGRCMDPAELFLWFLGKTEPAFDASIIVAQAAFGMADQLVLRVMDYMGWLGLLGLAEDAVDFFTGLVDDLIERLTGEDSAQRTVAGWIERTVVLTNAVPEVHTALFRADQDFSVIVPERTYFVENAAGELFPVWVGDIIAGVDVPQYDLLSSDCWADFYPDFKEHQGTMTDLVYDSVKRLAFDLASMCTLEMSGMAFDPADEKDLFTAMSERAGEVELVFSAAELADAGARLPMFSPQYDLAQMFSLFVSENMDGLIPYGLTGEMYDDLAAEVLSSATYPFIPDLAVPVEQQLEEIVRRDVEHDSEWGVGPCALGSFETIGELVIGGLATAVAQAVSRLDDGFAGPLVDCVAAALVAGTEALPGLPQTVEASLGAFAKAALAQRRISSFKQSVYLDVGSTFEFWDGDPTVTGASGAALETDLSVEVPGRLPELTVVPYGLGMGLTSLDCAFPADEVLVQVKRPWDWDRSDEGYPNTHLTSLSNCSATPYSTQWLVSVKGLVTVGVSASDRYLVSSLDDDAEADAPVRVSICVPVVVQSPWPLEGVEYNPTDTALTDAVDLATRFSLLIWDKLSPVVGWVKDGLEAIHHFVQDAFETLASFTTKAMKVVARCAQAMVETLQSYIEAFADSALARAVSVFLDIVGTVEFRVSLHGLTLIVQTNLPDLLFKKAQDLVRVIVCTDRLGPGMAFGVRVAKLSDGGYDIVVNGTLTLDSGSVEVRVDPLMRVMRRLVEVHCRMDSWALDMAVPEVEPYESLEASTADIPGLGAVLSNIPIPVLGLRASVEAGLRLKYSPPFPSDLVVNEFESNPSGDDSGREWVELYNPLSEPKCIDGWAIMTTHGEGVELPVSGTVPANGLAVFTFPRTSIDNGYPDDPFNDGDSLVLVDASGRTVDVTPTLSDNENDDRTLQRTWDGGPRWALERGSKGLSNGAPLAIATSDFIAQALFTAFKDAFEETNLSEVGASLEFVVLLAKRVLHHFIENLLSVIKEVIHEAILFVKVLLGDATGAAGAGVRASFVVTGDSVVELVRWLIHTVATFIVNIGRAGNPVAYPAFPQAFFSGLYLRFEVLSEVGAPKMMSVLGTTSALPASLGCVATVGPNIPCLGRLAGKDWGQWRVGFGVCFEGLPREAVSAFMVKDTGDTVDLWLVRGCAYGV